MKFDVQKRLYKFTSRDSRARAFCFGVGGHVTSENNVFNSESRKLYVNFMCCELICAD